MTRRQLTDEQWKLIEPYLPIGEYASVPREAAGSVRGGDLAVQDRRAVA